MHPLLSPCVLMILLHVPPLNSDATSNQLQFKQEGKNLRITLEIDVEDSPLLIWSHPEVVYHHDAHLQGPRVPPQLSYVELYYQVLQCRDAAIPHAPRKGTRKQAVHWVLKDHENSTVPYRVISSFKPSVEELSALLPELKKLTEEGDRLKSSKKHSP